VWYSNFAVRKMIIKNERFARLAKGKYLSSKEKTNKFAA
jgi:hypothetical protein